MNKHHVQAYRQLKDAQVEVRTRNEIQPNNGSETFVHQVAKLAAFRVLRENGYRVCSEVTVPNGEIDLLAWGNPERLTYAVEVETSPTEETINSKLDRYVKQVDPIDDLLYINASNMPMHMINALDYVRTELNL